MSILRVSDSLQFAVLGQRLTQVQLQIKAVNDQITTGQRLLTPDQDPVGASQVVRLDGDLAALAQYDESSQFGRDVLGMQDADLGQVNDMLVRAQEIAKELGSGAVTQDQRDAAASEVHELLKHLTQIGDGTLLGRRVYAGLQPDSGPAAFDDPDQVGYDPAAAYHGPTTGFSVRIAAGASDTVTLTTPGDQVFTTSLVALADLEDRLRTAGDVNGAITGLEAARNDVAGERASVGVREKTLIDRTEQVKAQVLQTKGTRSRIADTDLTLAITQLSQLQLALQATLAAGSQIAQTSLTSLLRL